MVETGSVHEPPTWQIAVTELAFQNFKQSKRSQKLLKENGTNKSETNYLGFEVCVAPAPHFHEYHQA